MDNQPQATVDRVYEDLDLHTEWTHEAAHDTLIAYLPGFRKEQLKVQVTTAGNLKLTGEREVEENKWSRFRKEFLIPSNCDINAVSANFKGGMLYVKLPKLIAPAPTTTPADYNQEKPKPPSTDVIPKLPLKQTTTDQTPNKDLQTQETKPVPPKTIPEKTEQPQKPPPTEPPKQQNGQEKTPEKETNARSDEQIIGADKDLKKEQKSDLVEDEKAKNTTELKAGQAEKLEACSIGKARETMMGSEILGRVGVYKEAVGDFVMALRSRRKLMAALAVLLVAVVLGLIAKKTIKSSDFP